MKYLNCLNCKYANINIDGSVNCDKNVLLDGRVAVIDKSKIEKNCTCHSDVIKEEIRYGYNNKYTKKSNDVCMYCQRIVRNMFDLQPMAVEKDDGVVKVMNVCNICVDKYFSDN